MRAILTILFAVLKLTVFGQTIVADLNCDNLPDTIILSSSVKNSSSFNRITISITRFGKQTFNAKNEWTNVDSTFLAENRNAVKSKRLFLDKEKNHSVILLFGNLDGAGYREEFSIIQIRDNKIKMVFDSDEKSDIEIPVKVTDINNDGKTDFIWTGFREMEEQIDSLNADVGSYTPYVVYTIGDTCALNMELTEKYNLLNYVWAGLDKTSNGVRVLYPRDGSKPKIIK